LAALDELNARRRANDLVQLYAAKFEG
jgi:hypothetical protein